ncbi:hypothetical protein ACG7TL_003519 [Trametes sanguinea]
MSGTWNALQDSMVVFEYSHLIVGIAGSSFGFATHTGIKILGHYFSCDALPKQIIERWRRILRTLTDGQKAEIEATKAGALHNMETRLNQLEQSIEVLRLMLKKSSVFGIAWPCTQGARLANQLNDLAVALDQDFTATTHDVLNIDNPVHAIVEAERAASVNAAHVEMIPLPSGNDDPGHASDPDPASATNVVGLQAPGAVASTPLVSAVLSRVTSFGNRILVSPIACSHARRFPTVVFHISSLTAVLVLP